MKCIDKQATVENIERIVQELSLKEGSPDSRLMLALRIRDMIQSQEECCFGITDWVQAGEDQYKLAVMYRRTKGA